MTMPPSIAPAATDGAANSLDSVFKPYWFLCDLDGTLTPSPHRRGGAHEPLTKSPCNGPVRAWLEGGGNLAVVSTAGTNLFRQVLWPLLHGSGAASSSSSSPPLTGALVLSGMSGAVMFRLDESWRRAAQLGASFTMTEVAEYRHFGGPGGSTTCLSNAAARSIVAASVPVYRQLFRILEDPAGGAACLALLSERYREPFACVVAARRERRAQLLAAAVAAANSASTEAALLPAVEAALDEETLSAELLQTRGRVLPDTALLCLQAVPRAELHSSSSCSVEAHASDEDCVIAQVSLLGVPQALFDRLFKETGVARRMSLAGLLVAKQPNSVAIVRKGVDKGTAIAWMLTHPEMFCNISPLRSFAVGDQPRNVDATMMRFSSRVTLPFFSVGRPLSRRDVDVARRELQIAVSAGGFVEWGDLVGVYEEAATALLFASVMQCLRDAAAEIDLSAPRAQSPATSQATPAPATAAAAAQSPFAIALNRRQLRMPLAERVLRELDVDSDDRPGARRKLRTLLQRGGGSVGSLLPPEHASHL
jgi:hypothetical protein